MFGSIPDWISAIIGLLALVAAFYAWKTNHAFLKLEQARYTESNQRTEKSQAVLISAWGAVLDNCDYEEKWSIVIDNRSNSQIYNLTVESQRIQKASSASPPVVNNPLTLSVLPPGIYLFKSKKKEESRRHVFKNRKTRNEGGGWNTINPINLDRQTDISYTNIMGSKYPMVTAVKFTDSYGITWERTQEGIKRVS